MLRITSRTNEHIKKASALKNRKTRLETGMFLCEGLRLVYDALLSGVEVRELYVSENALLKCDRIFELVSDITDVFEISESVADKLADTKSSQGVFAVCKIPADNFEIKSDGKYVVLENLQNPSNLGAVIRSAEAFGIDGAVLIGCTDPFSPKALRGGMGCVFRLPVCISDDLSVIEQLKNSGVRVFSSVVRNADFSIDKVDYGGGFALVIGNEGNGVSRELIDMCDGTLTIEMRGRAESLNAASAAAVMIYEMMKNG